MVTATCGAAAKRCALLRAPTGRDLSGGFYVEPTIFEGTSDMRIFQEEIFGPVLAVKSNLATFHRLGRAAPLSTDSVSTEGLRFSSMISGNSRATA